MFGSGDGSVLTSVRKLATVLAFARYQELNI